MDWGVESQRPGSLNVGIGVADSVHGSAVLASFTGVGAICCKRAFVHTLQTMAETALATAQEQHAAALAKAASEHAAALAAAREEAAAAAAASAAGTSEPPADGAAVDAEAASQQEVAELREQVEALQRENASLVEAERQTAMELSRRLNEIAARGQQAAESRVETELLSSAVETVQVGGCVAGQLGKT